MLVSWVSLFLFWATSLLSFHGIDKAEAATTADHSRNLIEWLRSHGGYFNPKLEIRRADPNDPESHYGMFTNEDLDQDELLVRIPDECKLTSEMENPDWVCTTTRNLHREMLLGDESKYAPFVNYLKDQPQGQLPSAWSKESLDLVFKVTGGELYDDSQIIPPSGPAGWLVDEWVKECNGGDDPYEQHVFLLVIQRGWDDIMLPIFDMINHRNGHWFNTKSNSVRDNGVDIEIKAKRPIKNGEEIYSSYNECEDCGGRATGYGTPEILRDYGFVEMYPQKWIFHDQSIGFFLDEGRNGELQLKWLDEDEIPGDDQMDFFEDQVFRLSGLLETDLSENNGNVPQNEFDMIVKFTKATVTAMEKLMSVVKGISCSVQEGTCKVSPTRYSQMDKPYTGYDITTCDRSISLDYSEYEVVDNVQSLYQAQEWIKSPDHRNVCFDLDDIYQQCTSYRPHYHEVFVHYTARFLPEIKRVLWVGGGDGMLLHEMLKYPSLEFAIGLELDQKVTRWSFKHFGSQPHWDNDKVQWWYGDAAKSLLMLPKEYFGSFDLVLVDLSETVMSMKVTKELDIMAALSLLIKPDGIFVKNELYFEKLNHLFKHTIQVNYYDVPAICSQSMVFGSNAVDFIHTNLTDHGVETLFSQLDELDTTFELVHDYKNNHEAKRLCKDAQEEKEPEEQEASPGIVMVLETEHVTADLSSPEKLEEIILRTLKENDLHVLDTVKSDSPGISITVIFREGYVIARPWHQHQYVAYDVHLWGSFEKLEALKSSLIYAVGSQPSSSSSYRVVAGGMFGADTWVNDTLSLGPRFIEECKPNLDPESSSKMDDTLVSDLVASIASRWLLPPGSLGVVICGLQFEQCDSAGAFENAYVEDSTTLYSCESLVGDTDAESRAEHMYSCEQELIQNLKSIVGQSPDGKIGALVVDPTASYEMLQVINRIASRLKNELFNDWGPMVVAPIVDPSQSWRRFFVSEFRRMYEFEPADVAQIHFNDTQSSVEINLFISGNKLFINDVRDIVGQVETKFAIDGEIRFVGGGRFNYQGDDWQPSQFFLADAYDQSNGLGQWQSQSPTGHQAVIQLVGDASNLSNEITEQLTNEALEKLGLESVPQSFLGFGEGSVTVCMWPAGNMVVLFDGREHISINVFTYDQDPTIAQEVSKHFQALEKSLRLALYDEMPRGYGRVVNWSRDIEPRQTPHWALHLEDEAMNQ